MTEVTRLADWKFSAQEVSAARRAHEAAATRGDRPAMAAAAQRLWRMLIHEPRYGWLQAPAGGWHRR